MMLPVMEPMPPSTTITRYSMDLLKPKVLAEIMPIWWAYSPPATPAKKAARVKASSLYRVVGMPVASLATSFSRMEMMARPWRERPRVKMLAMMATRIQNTMVNWKALDTFTSSEKARTCG